MRMYDVSFFSDSEVDKPTYAHIRDIDTEDPVISLNSSAEHPYNKPSITIHSSPANIIAFKNSVISAYNAWWRNRYGK